MRGRKQSKAGPEPAAVTDPGTSVGIPLWFRLLRWAAFSATVGIAIGMLALMDQQLTGISWVYDGTLTQYQGRNIRIQYCMFSSSTDQSNDKRCNFGFAVASVSLVLSFIWSYLQSLRRNPFRHPSVKLADLVLCAVWLCFWCAAAVVLCIWTNSANRVGSFLDSATNARNGFCVMAWVEFLLVAFLISTAALLYTSKCQAVFEKWDAKHKQKKFDKEQKRLAAQQAKVAEQDAAAAAAKQQKTAGVKQPAAAAAPMHEPAAPQAVAGGSSPAATATTPGQAISSGGRGQRDLEAGEGPTGVPVSTSGTRAVSGQPGAAGTGAGVGGGDDNPFR